VRVLNPTVNSSENPPCPVAMALVQSSWKVTKQSVQRSRWADVTGSGPVDQEPNSPHCDRLVNLARKTLALLLTIYSTKKQRALEVLKPIPSTTHTAQHALIIAFTLGACLHVHTRSKFSHSRPMAC
jgi:hypothetical protein